MTKARILRLRLLCATVGALAVTASLHAADIPNGSHLQNPELPAGLVSKTQDETAKAISRGEQLWGDRNLGGTGSTAMSVIRAAP